ncbi:rod shape-determining protein [Streptomyces albus]|uniref:rod shape-determining protein n=1 Tax=Streptomyces albus TaxID=1888 RepID=UPI00345430A0
MTAAHRAFPAVAPRPAWPLCRRCSGIALDLGSARTRVWMVGRGRIIDVPTVTFPGAGVTRPIQRGTIIDTAGTARLLDRLLGHRLSRHARPLVVLTAPVLGGVAYRAAAREAVEVLRPRTVLTMPTARAVAYAAGVDLTRALFVVDIGAHLTEVVLLAGGAVLDARRTALGTTDLEAEPTAARLVDAVVAMVTSMLEQDPTSHALDALDRGVLLAGGGALCPGVTYRLAGRLDTRVTAVPAPHTAAVRGAATLLRATRSHPESAALHPESTHPADDPLPPAPDPAPEAPPEDGDGVGERG